ncbi:MAG: translocation/assembly module TamB domain-containing protein [Bacteroidales bacterium]|nr:translocation/assembly module TamB domain-containing protein [Bacteroidales bacterium]
MGGKISKKIGKIILWVLLGFIALDLLIVGLLFVPAIQTFAVNKLTSFISEKWGSEISMKDVHVTPTLKLVAHDFRIHDAHHNDMIYVGTVKGRLNSFSIKPLKLKFGKVHLDHGNVVIRKYAGEKSVNIALWAKKFHKEGSHGTFLLTAKDLKLTNSRFVLIDDEDRVVYETDGQPDIDYAFFELKDINWEADDFRVECVGINTVAANFRHLAFKQYGGFEMQDGSGDFSICDTSLIFKKLKIKTPESFLNLDLAFNYSYWDRLGDFLDSVQITADVRPSRLAMRDVAGFAPAIKGMDETFLLKADRVQGSVNDFSIIGLSAGWGLFTRLRGDIALRNITDFRHAHFNLQIDSSTVSVPELANFTLPGGRTLPIPQTVSKMGNTKLKLAFTGSTSNFDAETALACALGTAEAALSSLVDRDGGTHLTGKVSSPDLNLAALTGNHNILGSSNFTAEIEGDMASTGLDAENLKTLTAHLDGTIQRLDIYHYPLRNVNVSADYQNRLYNGSVEIRDPNLKGNILGQFDITEQLPTLQGNVSLEQFDISRVADRLPTVDSASAKGIQKLIYHAQQSKDVQLAFDNFMIAFKGNKLDNLNGYLGCDNIRYQNDQGEMSNKRLRLTAINKEDFHKFILSSSLLNATLESSYPTATMLDSLKGLAFNYFPDLFKNAVKKQSEANVEDVANQSRQDGYIKAHVATYNTYNLVRLFYPNIFIAPNCNLDLEISSSDNDDVISASVPFFGVRHKVAVYNLSVDGSSKDHRTLDLNFKTDSVIAIMTNTRIPFDQIALGTRTRDDTIHYDLRWQNRFNSKTTPNSQMAGMVSLDDLKDIAVNISESGIYINNHRWEFTDGNSVRIQPDGILIHNLVFTDDQTRGISADGLYSKKKNSELKLKVNDMDVSMVNPVVNGMEFDGLLSADFTVLNRDKKMITFGKALISDFKFNRDSIGDVFALAALDTVGKIIFTGGIFQESKPLMAKDLTTFDIRQFMQAQDKTAEIRGHYIPDKKNLAIHTSFDSLSAGFLTPFLSSFSNYINGKASGKLSFYSTPKSSYFDGTVHVVDANMDISSIGTNYNVKDQDIGFDAKGIHFDNMRITDLDGNVAYMNGHIHHNFFRDMTLDLNIRTNRLQVLNTPKDATSIFYGTGYASGMVSITGDGDKILIKGDNLQTLTGTKITLQVSSANSASQSDIIQFKPKASDKNDDPSSAIAESESKTNILLDFTFDVKNDANIVLILESIGGTMNARADGLFQLTYDMQQSDLNLYGNLSLHSGDFKIALYNLLNSRLTLVPGGTIHFDGPLEDMIVSISAYKTSKTSLTNIIPEGYASGNAVPVNAYMHLNGPIMKQLEPTFSFELPNSSDEFRNLFYTAIDTSNKENTTKQFAYFLITNNFMASDLFSGNGGGFQISNIFRNMVNNMLSSLMENQKGSFGITYNQETETSAAEYGLTANASLLKDRMTLETSIGYYDDATRSAANNMYGDLMLQYSLNKTGTWKVKAYTNIGERNEDYYMHDNQINYVAGVALAFKQDFNSKRKQKNNAAKNTVKKNGTKKSKQNDKNE